MFSLEDKFCTLVIALLSLYNWDTNNVSAAWLCLKMNFFSVCKDTKQGIDAICNECHYSTALNQMITCGKGIIGFWSHEQWLRETDPVHCLKIHLIKMDHRNKLKKIVQTFEFGRQPRDQESKHTEEWQGKKRVCFGLELWVAYRAHMRRTD